MREKGATEWSVKIASGWNPASLRAKQFKTQRYALVISLEAEASVAAYSEVMTRWNVPVATRVKQAV